MTFFVMSDRGIGEKRTPFYDVAKGICIISVVLGHLGIATRFVYFYHLSIFFFISGLFLNVKKHSFKDFFLKKIKSLYIPYVIFSLLFAIFFDFSNMTNIKYVLRIFLFDSKAPFTGTFWFIPCLFINSMLAFLTGKVTLNFDMSFRKRIYYGLFCFYVILTFIFCKLNFQFYYNLHLIPWIQIIYILAFLYNSYQLKLFQNRFMSLIIGLCAFILLLLATLFTNFRIDIVNNQFSNSFFWLVIIFIGICFVFAISFLLQNIKVFSFIGKHSFYIMCFHFITFALINFCISGFKNFDLDWRMKYPTLWYFYIVGGVFLPVGLSVIANYFKKKLIYYLLCKN